MEYRTKSTIEESITRDHRLADGARLVEYQPGNGTRYILLVNRVEGPSGARELLSLPDVGGWIISRLIGHQTSVLVHSAGGTMHWSYVMEKFRCGRADAVVLAELIGHLTGIHAMSCAEVRAEDARFDAEQAENAPS